MGIYISDKNSSGKKIHELHVIFDNKLCIEANSDDLDAKLDKVIKQLRKTLKDLKSTPIK